MKRKFIITDETREWIGKSTKLTEDELEKSLMSHTDNLVMVTSWIRMLSSDLIKAKRDYDEIYWDRYAHYGYQSDKKPDNEKERIGWTLIDDLVVDAQELVDEIDLDRNEIIDVKEALKNKGFSHKNLIDWKKFLAGD